MHPENAEEYVTASIGAWPVERNVIFVGRRRKVQRSCWSGQPSGQNGVSQAVKL